jgi:hypothetical protein
MKFHQPKSILIWQKGVSQQFLTETLIFYGNFVLQFDAVLVRRSRGAKRRSQRDRVYSISKGRDSASDSVSRGRVYDSDSRGRVYTLHTECVGTEGVASIHCITLLYCIDSTPPAGHPGSVKLRPNRGFWLWSRPTASPPAPNSRSDYFTPPYQEEQKVGHRAWLTPLSEHSVTRYSVPH